MRRSREFLSKCRSAAPGAHTWLTIACLSLLVFSAYGTLFPGSLRCGLPGAVGCPGGLLGPAVASASAGEQWFTVTMYDWGFWVVDSTTGANETSSWNVFEGWTVHINATSLPPDAAIGGTAYHGLGVEINATGQQLLSLAAPVGKWTQGAFIAPTSAYFHQHIWCTIGCGPGHGSQQAWILNVIPALPIPKATATANVTSGAAPLSISFAGSATLGTPPYNVSWDFGDGSPLTFASDTNHTYSLGGDYTARFLVTDSKGMTAAASLGIGVNSTSPLTARVSSLPASGVAPFSSLLSVIGHGGVPPYTFEWSFGDGQFQNGTNLTQHLYLGPGVYAVVATVRDSAGATVRGLSSVTVLPATGSFPVVVTSTPPNGSSPLAITLAAAPAGGSGPYTYLWVLGDGTTTTGASANHQYNQTGSYVATVFVKDAAGRAGVGSVIVPVTMYSGGGGGDNLPPSGAPAASSLTLFPLGAPNDGGSPLTVNASVSIEGGTALNETVTWSFGDGTTGTGQFVSHQFRAVGTYHVSVTATDSGGNGGTNSTEVRVEPLGMTMELNRTAGDDPFSLGAGVTIVGGTGWYGPVTWTWGDGTTSTGNLGNHTYAPSFAGTVNVQVRATDSGGAPVSTSATVQVYPQLVATLTESVPSFRATPITVGLTLSVSGGSGSYASAPFWNFGDGSSTRGGSPASHPYAKAGDFHVMVQTNDSLGTPVTASVWVNLSLDSGSGSGGPPPWSLTGVSDPNRVALILIGLVAASGLILVRRRRTKAKNVGPKTPVPRHVGTPPRPGPAAPPNVPKR